MKIMLLPIIRKHHLYVNNSIKGIFIRTKGDRTKHDQKQAIYHPIITTNAYFTRFADMDHMQTTKK